MACRAWRKTIIRGLIAASALLLACANGGLVLAASPDSNSASTVVPGAKASPSTKAPRKRTKAKAAKPSDKAGSQHGKAMVPPDSPFAGLNVGNSHEPINIRSDRLALDYHANTVMFQGHVRAIQAGGELTSDKLTVSYGSNFHDIKQMVADGNVRISQGTRWATGDHAVLDQDQHTVVLTGSPVVHDGNDQITGSRITAHLDTGQSVVEEARAVIFPRNSQTPNNKRGADSVH